MIKDFIKSWIYYPKLVKWCRKNGARLQWTRLGYSLWHCRQSKTRYDDIKIPKKRLESEWISTYHTEPIQATNK